MSIPQDGHSSEYQEQCVIVQGIHYIYAKESNKPIYSIPYQIKTIWDGG